MVITRNYLRNCGLLALILSSLILGASVDANRNQMLSTQTPEGFKQIEQILDFPFESNAPMGSAKNPAVIIPAATAALIGDLPAAKKAGDKLLIPIAELQKAANQPLVGSLLSPILSRLGAAKSFDGFSAIDTTATNSGLPSVFNVPDAMARKVSGEDMEKTRSLLRNGDILFGSHVFNWMTWGQYIHVGIVSDAQRGKILEATANGPSDKPGVRETDWSHYANSYGHMGVGRVRGASADQIARVIRWIEDRKGLPYRWPILMGLDNNDESRFYCSQLVWRAYKQVMNIDLDSDQGALVFPDDIYRSQAHLDVIVP